MVIVLTNFRGTGTKREQPFRESYGRIGHLRSFTKAPFLCMTATASLKIRSKIMKLLNMSNAKLIRHSPDKKNICYHVQKAADLDETFQWMVNLVSSPVTKIPKTIIYCRSLKGCGELYSLFDEAAANSEVPVVTMYHSKTPEQIKQKVLSSLLEENRNCRIVIATSALGMGVKSDIRQILHYGTPPDLESYLQEVGRGVRDGKPCKATLYHRPFHLAHCDEHMRNFLKNTDGNCRRKFLMNYFKEKPDTPDLKHDCCDVCQAACKCSICSTAQTTDTTLVNEAVEMPTMARHVQEEDREFLQNMLKDIKISSGTASSVFGSADLVSELGEEVIEAIVSKCEYIFSVSFIMDNFPVFSKQVANEIITVFNETFNDIEEAEFLTNRDEKYYF